MAAKTIVMTGYVEYARVFKHNMDANPEFHPTGQFNVNFYPESQEDLQKFWDSGVPESFRGNSRLKSPREGDGYGIGQFIRLKRDNENRISDDLGGPPEVVWFTEGNENKAWDTDTDGELGNGTKVRVKVTVYGSGDRTGHRLEKIGVLDLVPYEKRERDPLAF